MQLSDTVTLAAPRDRVYAALTDPAVLEACIPGCTAMTDLRNGHFEVKMSLPTGLHTFEFEMILKLDTRGAPSRLTFSRGPRTRMEMILTEAGEMTMLSYTARAQLRGRAAVLGGTLLGGVAGRLAAGFFDRLGKRLAKVS